MKSFVWISLVAASVLAQQQNNGIPSGISAGCNNFLQSFNNDKSMAKCLQGLLTATARFNPSSNLQSNQGDITWAMEQLTSAKNDCKASDMQTIVTNFYGACADELTSGNQPDLETTFEVAYIMVPMINAVTAKDTDGTWCLSKAKKAGGHSEGNSQATMQIKQDHWRETNVHFLFANPNSGADQLCTTCMKHVMTSYISYENNLPFPMGMKASGLLGENQKALWDKIKSTCSADYAASILSSADATVIDVNNVAAANGASSVVLSTTGVIGALMAVAAALA